LRATHHFEIQNRVPLLGARGLLHVALGVAAVSAAYFFAAHLSLALITPSNGVAVFWPAAGIASGLVIALGSASRLPVALGVMPATIVADLLEDRNLPASIVFAVCNAGEVLLIGWLVKSYLSENLALDSLRNVLGLLAATAIGTAVSAIGGTAGYILFHNMGAPAPRIWFDWFAADALGVVTVAPVIIGLVTTAQRLPDKKELFNGLVGLVAIALISTLGFSSSTEHWFTILPVSLVLPIAFWVTARCPPVFAASAAFIVAFAVVWTITFGIGRLGDAAVPLTDRVLAAQVALVAMSSALLILAALFQERRHGEAALKEGKDRLQESNDRLQLALSAAKLGVFSIDLSTGRLECDAQAAFLHGYDEIPETVREGRRFIHRDDLALIGSAFAEAPRANGAWRTEYRVVYPKGHQLEGKVRWVALDGAIASDGRGQSQRMLGVVRDKTERKLADQTLRNQEKAFRRLLGSLPAAIHTTDTSGRITFCNKAAVDLWGVSPELGKDKCSDLGRLFYPDGTLMPVDLCPTGLCLTEGRAIPGREALFERPDGRRIPIIPYPAPLLDESGAVVGVVSMKLDITERKKAEAALADRNAQLALARRVALVGSHTYDCVTGITALSPGSAAIYGLPEATTELSREESRACVHADDLEQLEEEFQRALGELRREFVSEFRITRADNNEVRWIEARSTVSYDAAGRPLSLAGVSIDVTERKRSEDHQVLLISELDHRVKNVLACVTAIAQHASESSRSKEDFLEALDGRIRSLANTHILLSQSRWHGVDLAELVRTELAPCGNRSTLIEGPSLTVVAEAAQTVAMVLHELATNAAKYGALSNCSGQVSVVWRWRSNGSECRGLALEWRETGGPPVGSPHSSGHGTSVIRDLIPYELGGTVDYVLAPDGVRCKLEIPAPWLSIDARHPALNGADEQPHQAS
jgi:PAS domain S-box-containing protein